MWYSIKYLLVTVSLCMIVSLSVLGRERARGRLASNELNEEREAFLERRIASHASSGPMHGAILPPVLSADDFGSLSNEGKWTGGSENLLLAWTDENRFRMPGEFEPQQALLLASGRLASTFPNTLVDIASAVRGRVLLVTLIDSDEEASLVHETLRNQNLTENDIRTVSLAIDSQWVRDYGPLFVRDWQGQISIVDAAYDGVDRPNDDGVPDALGKAIGIPVLQLPIILDGGNLLSNGNGLSLATSTLLAENQAGGLDETSLRESLATYLGCEQLVLLEPLAGEPTGHVDMFATFTDSRTVVIAACDPEVDPVNARILDENTARLTAVREPFGPLRVVRIPMPTHADGVWRTYNNVVFANGVILMPVYPGADPDGERIAMQIYGQVLPTWQVIGIDASGIIQLDGALHCITMNVPANQDR